MQVRLDCPKRPAGQRRDLVQGPLGEKSEGDHLAIRFIERSNRITHRQLAFAAKHQALRIGGPVRSKSRHGIVGRAIGSNARTDPGYGPSSGRLADRESHRDAREPGAERAFGPPRGERAIRGHECFLGDIFSLAEITEDAMTGTNDRRRFPIHEGPERIAVTGEDRLNDRLVISVRLRELVRG